MSDSKFLKILYAIICFMLLAFFGCGGYFIYQGVYGAGLIAIGIGVFGFGIALFLGTGLLFVVDDENAVKASKSARHSSKASKSARRSSKASKSARRSSKVSKSARRSSKGNATVSGKALMKNVLYTLPALCDCCWFPDGSNVEVSVSEIGFSVRSSTQGVMYVRFSDILRVAYFENQFLVMGNVERDMQFVQEAIILTIENKMKCKMFEKTLLSENIEFAEESVAQSVIADVRENRTYVVQECRSIKKRG